MIIQQDKKLGFINLKNNNVIKPQYDKIEFANDYTYTIEKITQISLKDLYKITPLEYLAILQNNKWGLVDINGSIIIEPKYDILDNLFMMKILKKLINDRIKNKSLNNTKDVRNIGNGNIILITRKTGYVSVDVRDNKGNLISRMSFDDAFSFSDEYKNIVAVKKGSKWGLLNNNGKLISQPQFDSISSFNEGLAAVKVNKKWGFIDTNGKVVIKPQFDYVEGFHEGLSVVEINNKFGLINKTGKPIIKPQFDSISSFFGGMATVEKDAYLGVIDLNGNYILKPQLKTISFATNNSIFYTLQATHPFVIWHLYCYNISTKGLVIKNNNDGKIGLLFRIK